MAEQKFHVNEKHEVGACRARVRPCRFGSEVHFSSREAAEKEAEKQLKKEYASLLKSMKKEEKALPATVNLSLLKQKDATPEEKADVLLFEAMKRDDSFALGEGRKSSSYYYYGAPTFDLEEATIKKLQAHGVKVSRRGGRIDNRKLLEGVTSLELVPGSLTSATKNYFNGTYDYSGQAHYLQARAVATFADGGRMEVPVGAAGGFNDFLNATIDIADEERAGRNAERVLEEKAREQVAEEELHEAQAEDFMREQRQEWEQEQELSAEEEAAEEDY